jgi:hypothetical protein
VQAKGFSLYWFVSRIPTECGLRMERGHPARIEYAGETPALHVKLTIPLAETDGNACNVALRALGHGTPCPYISPDGGRAATAAHRDSPR